MLVIDVYRYLWSFHRKLAFIFSLLSYEKLATMNYIFIYLQMHYLLYGKGFQTWEYSPEYALRSYAYLWLHALPLYIYNILFGANKVIRWYSSSIYSFPCVSGGSWLDSCPSQTKDLKLCKFSFLMKCFTYQREKKMQKLVYLAASRVMWQYR